jgi:DNA-binding CsgD family transcriptional regulator
MPNKNLSKDVMLQKRAEGKTNEQIAAELGCSKARVYQLVGGVKQYKPRAERAKEEIAEQAQ